jgi:hypothetical protein
MLGTGGYAILGPRAALVEATIDLTASNPSKAKHYRDSGFQMFWSGVTK